MATEDLNPAGDNAHGPELPPMMPLEQPGAHGTDPNGDAAWVAGVASSQAGEPTHHDGTYETMTTNPPGAGTHAATPYEEIRHTGQG